MKHVIGKPFHSNKNRQVPEMMIPAGFLYPPESGSGVRRMKLYMSISEAVEEK